MSADLQATENDELHNGDNAAQPTEDSTLADGSEEEDEEDEDEPKLKYTKFTGSLTSVYRSGDSTSAFTVAGDKMALGTHNGNIHVLTLPTLKSLRTYHAHSATITCLSISPTPPTPSAITGRNADVQPPPPLSRTANQQSSTSRTQTQPRPSQQQGLTVPNTSSNALYIATSSLDGHVCISSLLDPKDVQLRNFARPVSAVALSPRYKSDRMYISGGLAGQLILTTGGKTGTPVDANTNSSAAAAASGWMSSMGFGGDRGKDEVLHSGEGGIKEIKWSLTGKWVVWINEEGIKIMRSHLRLGSEESEDAWRRIAHAARPNRKGWEELGSVWRGRAEWVDERKIESDDDVYEEGKAMVNGTDTSPKKATKVEKLVVGWGDTAWMLHVREGGISTSATGGKRQVGSADIIHKLQFRDCIVSGISLYTPSLLAILAYRTRDDDDKPIAQQPPINDTPRKGRHHRQTGLKPQLRLINVVSGEEVDLDELPISRFDTLSAQDYHLSTLYIPPPPPPPPQKQSSGGTGAAAGAALEGIWDAAGGKYASRMFSSSASVLSNRSSSGADVASPPSSAVGVAAPTPAMRRTPADVAAHPFVAEPGLKLFIQSPYDCVLAVKRDLRDRLKWLMERRRYQEAWELVGAHPEVVDSSTAAAGVDSSRPSTPSKNGSLADFFADDAASQRSGGSGRRSFIVEKEKKRIGDLWLQQLVSASRWEEAGKVAGKVLGTSNRWEHWVWTFAQANEFDAITPHIPSTTKLPGVVYELVLGHYVYADRKRLKELLEEWDPALGLYDVGSVIKAIEARLEQIGDENDVKEGSEDWRILMECLAKLYLADGRVREALRCWIHVQNADEAFKLLKEEKAVDIIDSEDVPGLLMLRVGKDLMKSGGLRDLETASEEAVHLLVEEAHQGTVTPRMVIRELKRQGPTFTPFLFFYLRALWHGTPKDESQPKGIFDRRTNEGHMMVEDHADLAVELFAEYDRDLLMTFLRASTVYDYEKAAAICEKEHYIPELVYVLSKTGQTKRALFLIIDELGDVSQAIEFAKENPDLWDDLLDYSMDKPRFIRGLLEEVGTAIDPIQLVRRIPEGLEIEGLREGVKRMMMECDVQFSISEGVARVLRGEVAMGMETLRAGRAKGVSFEVVHEGPQDVEVSVKDPPTKTEGEQLPLPKSKVETQEARRVRAGSCVGCGEIFHEDGMPRLVPSLLPTSKVFANYFTRIQRKKLSSASPAATSTISRAYSKPTPLQLTQTQSPACRANSVTALTTTEATVAGVSARKWHTRMSLRMLSEEAANIVQLLLEADVYKFPDCSCRLGLQYLTVASLA